MNHTAILSNRGEYTIFRFNKDTIRFKSPISLEYYADVKEWDHGYLVVDAKYSHNNKAEEEYIDLIPILENLYIDPDEFLNPIKNIVIDNECNFNGYLELH